MAITPGSDVIEFLKKKLGLDEKIMVLPAVWEKVLGPLAAGAEITGIKSGQLLVDVVSSAHFQEITLRRREIINKMNQHFGRERVVRDIKIRIKQTEA